MAQPNPEALKTAAKNYLSKKPVVLWGDFDLTTSFDAAVDWLTEQTVGVIMQLQEDQKERNQTQDGPDPTETS